MILSICNYSCSNLDFC